MPKTVTPAKRKIDGNPDEPSPNNASHPTDEARVTPMQEPQDTPARIAESDQDGFHPFESRAQILELDSVNPIVSYQGEVFSCTWSDLVGTNMFFTHPETTDATEALRSTDDYNLIGLSRIKLIGHRAKITKRPAESNETDSVLDGQPRDSNNGSSSQNTDDRIREKQASFLERLMEINARHREKDVVQSPINQEMPSTDQETSHEPHNIQALEENAGSLVRPQEVHSQSDGNSPESTGTPHRADKSHAEANENI
ncbi:hypothetical protein, variant [Phialophora macrospora]|nr:hypothetical protein, variant [Phialophora macrospora]